jgi:hypothetical protein
MTEQQPESFDALWRESIENHVAAMSDTDFADLVSRTRPHTATAQNPLTSRRDLSDPADRQRAIFASIQDKQQRLKPKREDVNANGYTTGPVNTTSHQPERPAR